MGVREWAFGHYVAGRVKGMKQAWQFLDGWKTFLVAALLLLEVLAKGTHYEGPLSYVRSLANALGWRDVAPAFDPGTTAAAIATFIALGHKVLKAIAQYRAGVSVSELHP